MLSIHRILSHQCTLTRLYILFYVFTCEYVIRYLHVTGVISCLYHVFFFFFSSRRRHTRLQGDWSSDVCSSDLARSRLPCAGGSPCAASASARARSFERRTISLIRGILVRHGPRRVNFAERKR